MINQADSIWTIVSSLGTLLAALFAAVAAVLMASIQHKHELEAARPEITLDGWTRGMWGVEGIPESNRDAFVFDKISNVGKGPAYDVRVRVTSSTGLEFFDGWELAFMNMILKPIILPGKELSVNQAAVIFYWDRVTDSSIQKRIDFDIKITCECSKGYFHDSTYKFYATDNNKGHSGNPTEEVVNLVHLRRFNVTRTALWKIRFKDRWLGRLSRIPIIGKRIKFNRNRWGA